MPKRSAVEQALQHGLIYLRAEQQADGGYVSYSSDARQSFKSSRTYHTTFVPALMLAALEPVSLAEAGSIREQLASFLLAQKGPNGAFNYWANNASERQGLSYPDDLDDTFCALISLYLHNPTLVDAKTLAQAVKLLLSTETAVGGPYRTWLVADTSDAIWLDVDVAVNTNVAYFLSLVSSVPPGLETFMDNLIADDLYSSPYYPSAYPLVYYLSRVYRGDHQQRLLTKIRQLQRQPATTALERALCLTARLKLGDARNLPVSLNILLAEQQPDGAWPAAAFCFDPARDGHAYTNGCAALTTAFVCEALQLSLDAGSRTALTGVAGQPDPRQAKLKTRILAMAQKQCRDQPADLRQTLLGLLTKQASGDTGSEIINLARQFSDSLVSPMPTASKSFIDGLGLANLYGWAAYTVYDDFLDGSGQPILLSAANVAMRNSLDCFSQALTFHRPFQALIRRVFDTIDGANAWELAHCRFERHGANLVVGKLPDYGNLDKLAERSLGHALPALAVLLAAGIEHDSSDFDNVRQALIHYLIARQLNDDAHDWAEDLAEGRITYVVGQLLATGLAHKPGRYRLAPLIAACRRQLWHSTLPLICGEMERQVTAGRQALKQVSALKTDNAIAAVLDGIEKSIEETLAKYRQAQGFLKHYGKGLAL